MTQLYLDKGKYPVLREDELRKQLQHEGFSCFDWQDGPGETYSPHRHSHDEFIVVYSGSIVFMIDNQRYVLEAGDVLHLPAQTLHSAVNEQKKTVKYFVCTKS